MKAKLHLVFTITMFLFAICGQAQEYWQKTNTRVKNLSPAINSSDGEAIHHFLLNRQLFDKTVGAISKDVDGSMAFPTASGTLENFTVRETPVFHPELSKKYPNIKSFTGWSQDKKRKIRFSTSEHSIQATLVDLEKGMYFIQQSDNGQYEIYSNNADWFSKDGFICETKEDVLAKGVRLQRLVDDQTLRKFRIAVSTTGEYTTYHGGTVVGALAAINATLTRVNEVFETDLGITLELIANNDEVIFTNSASDPYNGNLNSQVQSTLSSTIGEANYDVGHLFHRANNNGNAGFIGSVCVDGRKGSAFSAGQNPEGDTFDIDFVAHELGHQFGANHTWSFESEGTGVQAEPASGTTIMGYAGIVEGNDVQPNSDDYFHYNSILQITQYVQSVSCAETIALTNSPPVINPLDDFVIPIGTAFVLTGNATDVDTDNVLTYTWEQIDDGVVTTDIFGPQNPGGANFRSLPPTTDRNRYFPRLSEVVQGNLIQTQPAINSAWETVSNVQRELNFALTVRDNGAVGGQVSTDLLNINVVDAAGPFVITSQTTNEVYEAGSIQQVTWDVSNTDLAPVNAETVDIFLSLDGGNTFPLFLAENLPNSGSAEVLLPGNATAQARFMVKASDNIFFAINSVDFTIQETAVVLDFPRLEYEVCQPSDLDISFSYRTYGGFSEESTFSADAPSGLTVVFSPTTATSDDTPVTLTVSNTGAIAEGSYPVTINANSASETQQVVLNIDIQDTNFENVILSNPTNGALNTSVNPLFEWQNVLSATAYDIEIATDAGFTAIVETSTLSANQYRSSQLQAETNYFWRVRPKNSCGEGTFGLPFSFTTNQIDCKSLSASGFPLEISANGTPTVTSSITFLEDLPITDMDVNLSLEHSFLEDLVITMTSPSGKSVVLVSKNCGSLNDLNATFDDDGSNISCGGNPAISGTVKPLGSLSSFNGESLLGEWTLAIQDTAPSDGGSLLSFSMDVCAEGVFRPDDDEDGVFDDGDDLCLGTPKGTTVDTNGCPLNDFAQNNFLIEINSEACRNTNDGSVEVTAMDNAIDYTATLVGNGLNQTIDFTDSNVFGSLSAGQYSLCISGTEGTTNYREVCFELVVNEPEVLSTSTILFGERRELTVRLSGASLYNIELNGISVQTTETEITLDLARGPNLLKVSSNLPCQGIYEEEILIFDRPVIFPNPVQATADIYFQDSSENVLVKTFSVNGQLVDEKTVPLIANKLSLDYNGLRTGVYYVNILSNSKNKTLKMIKQ